MNNWFNQKKRTLPFICFPVIWLPVLAVLLSACSVNEDPPDPTAEGAPGNVLRVDVDYDFGPFCPHAKDCSGSGYVFSFIYSFLCVSNPDGGLEPDLAVRWEYDPKTFAWRFHLREDARFHNGEPVTAEDAAYSISIMINNIQQGLAGKIKGIAAVDDHVLEIRLKQDDPSFLEGIWDLEIYPSPDRHPSVDLGHSPVGSGPFRFEEKTDDGRVILAANDQYYRGRPAIDRVVFYYIPDREDSWTRLITGETDMAGDLTLKDYQLTQQYADRVYFSISPYQYYTILLYNARHSLFENPMVRRALTHAINRDAMVQNLLDGMTEIVAGPMATGSGWHDPDLKPLPYDPPLALALLEKAGWTLDPRTQYLMKDGAFFEFDLLLPSGSETDLRIARFIQLCLNDVGIRAHLKSLPLDVLHERYYRNTDSDAVLTELNANIRRPEEILGLWVKMEDTLSMAGGFDSPEGACLAGQILGAKDPETRKSLFQEFDRLIAGLQPGSFLFQKIYLDAMSKRFALDHPFIFDCAIGYRMQAARLKPAENRSQ